MSDKPLQNHTVVTANGERTWQAEDACHAREQHEDAFADQPGEKIISLRRESGPDEHGSGFPPGSAVSS
ncbi:MAG: hypothetical protein ACRDK7_08305 [Solirubrobacteraceae bacterium]